MDWLVEHPRYAELVAALDAGQAWRSLAEIGDQYGSVLSEADVARAQWRPSPARFLLERLAASLERPLTAEEARLLLQALGGPAAAAADLLRPPEPVRVRPLPDSNSACVWAPLGGRLLLLCEAAGWPPPTFLWRRDGRPLSAAGAQLCVEPFTAADSGRYQCEVRDAAGRALDAGAVTVQPRQTPPQPRERRVSGGELAADGRVAASGQRPLTLQVAWLGWPEPQLRWERDGQTLPAADRDRLTLPPGPDLRDGAYVCVAANAVGKVPCEPFRVEVDRRPVVLVHPERPAQCHPIGRPLTLQCEAFCRRPLKVIWRRSLEKGGGRDEVVSARHVHTEDRGDGVVRSELRLVPAETEARQLCTVTCEFLADGDFEDSYTSSLPAKFRVVYPAHSKMALIIGNSNYKNLPGLHEVQQDVANFRSAMRELGFGTLLAMNLTKERCQRALQYFAHVAAPGAYLVVLVAGHGFTHQRQDYLAPVDHPPLEDGPGIEPARCLSVLEDIEYFLQRTAPKLLVVCGDMCRTMNEACGGVAVTGPPPAHPPNVVRIFSTQMGQAAMDESTFMRRLLQNIRRDISVQQLSVTMLGAVSGQVAQHPVVELSIADRRSLRDPADNATALDAHVDRSTRLERSNLVFETSWSNYIWDGEPELLLTLRLRGAPAGYYVHRVITDSNSSHALVFLVESADACSPDSTWRATGLPADGGVLSVSLVVCVRSQAQSADVMPYRLGLQQIRLDGSVGLHEFSDVTPPPQQTVPPAAEQKISNVPDADC